MIGVLATTLAEGLSDDERLMVAALTVISLLAGAIVLLVRTYAQAKGANQAVNNIGPGDHSLFDQIAWIRADLANLVEAQRQFDSHGWGVLPPDLADGVALTQTIREIQRDVRTVRQALEEHVLATIPATSDNDE